jgi:hypothetical protein
MNRKPGKKRSGLLEGVHSHFGVNNKSTNAKLVI